MTVRALLLLIAASALPAQVSFERLVRAAQEPRNWLTYSGTYSSWRYSPLEQITPANAKNLGLQWVFQARSLEMFEATPLVVDGIMYLTQPPNDVVALDASTGRIFWTYDYRPAPGYRSCCGSINRGLAILGNTLFMGTMDAHLIAIDAVNGRPLWNVEVADRRAGYAITHAPLVVKDKVLVGVAGGEYGIRGFLAAYEAATGKETWRVYTVPGPGEAGHETWSGNSWEHGGAPIWLTGSYDPGLNLTYWGVGNPGPDYDGDARTGTNLYSNCVVALNADTGKIQWHFQFTPHDEMDYDAVQVPVLVDMDWKGTARKLMLWANRNGFFYVLDRASGEFLLGKPFAKQTWAIGLDEQGKPIRNAGATPSADGTRIFPGLKGATNWYSPSYSPRTKLLYIPTWENYYAIFNKFPVDYRSGQRYTAGTTRSPIPILRPDTVNRRGEEDGYGVVRAIDPRTGERKWEYKMTDVTDSGILTTATDLLFTGGREGYFLALDARTGQLLWKAALGGQVASGPISYSVHKTQYVAIAAGNALFTFAVGK
jgi:alcohol dehydrogenase (cytochrome c)